RLALELHARDGSVFAGNPPAHKLLEIVQRLGAERLGELIVHLRPHGLGHLLHHDGELRILAGDFLAWIVVRELHLDEPFLASLCTLEALDEAGDELSLAHNELNVLALAPLELHVTDAAYEIDCQPIAFTRRPISFHLILDGAL